MSARRSLSLGLGAVLLLSLAAPVATAVAAPEGKVRASSAAPADIALAFARSSGSDFGLGAGQARTLAVAKEQALTTGATAVHLGQRVEGLRVTDAVLTVVVGTDGRVVSAAGRLTKGPAASACHRT